MADIVRFKDIFNNPEALSFKDMYAVEYRPGEDELVNYRAYRRKRTIGVGEGGPVGESYELDEMRQSYAVVDTADGNKVVGTASDEKGAKSIISTSQLPPMKIKDKKTLKIVKVKKKQMIGYPIKEEKEEPNKSDSTKEVDEALTTTQSLKKARDFKKTAPKRKLGRERAKRKMADIKKLTKRANKQARNAYFLILSKGVPRSEMSFAQRAVIDKRMETPAAKTKIKRNARKMFPQIRKAEVQRKKG